MSASWELRQGDVLERLREMAEGSVQCCITSPPYFGLRDYGVEGQIGLEASPDEFVARLVEVFAEVRRVLRDDGTLWLNLGDSYAGSGKGPSNNKPHRNMSNTVAAPNRWISVPDGVKGKDLLGIPWMVAFALRAHGWYLRRDIIWNKPNPMPESVKDRPTSAHEYVFLLSKSPDYFYDNEAIRETDGGRCSGNGFARPEAISRKGRGQDEPWVPGAGRNKRSVWEIATQPYRGAHFAVWPEALVLPMVLAGSRPGDLVLDPFAGSGTTLKVAVERGRDAIGIELNPEYGELAERRLAGVTPPLFSEAA